MKPRKINVSWPRILVFEKFEIPLLSWLKKFSKCTKKDNPKPSKNDGLPNFIPELKYFRFKRFLSRKGNLVKRVLSGGMTKTARRLRDMRRVRYNTPWNGFEMIDKTIFLFVPSAVRNWQFQQPFQKLERWIPTETWYLGGIWLCERTITSGFSTSFVRFAFVVMMEGKE